MRKGFTLVELMVVMSIVSLLSSTVYTSTNQAKAKARLVATEVEQKSKLSLASQNTASALTFNTVDDVGGQVVYKDKVSGMQFVKSGSVTQSQDIPMWNDNFLNTISNDPASTNTEGSTDNSSISVDTSSSLVASTPGQGLIGQPLKTHSINLWVKYTGTKAEGTLIKIMDTSSNTSNKLIGMIRLNTVHCSYGRFVICQTAIDDSVGPGPTSYNLNFTNIQMNGSRYIPPLNEWINVAYSYDYDQNNLKIYINGQKVYDNTGYNIAGLDWVVQSVYIAGSGDFNGLIDSVSIYNSVLTVDDIKSIYAQGLKVKNVASGK